MGDIAVELVLYYGGYVVRGDICRYEGGESKVMESELDVDLLSYPNILSYVKELGYSKIHGLYYRKYVGGEFIEVIDDHLMMEISSCLKNGDKLEFYIESDINTNEMKTEVQPRDCQPFVQVCNNPSRVPLSMTGGENINIDEGPPEVREWCIYKGNEGATVPIDQFGDEEDWVPIYVKHQTFDEICLNVAGLTDDEDEELQEAREKVRAVRLKQKSQSKCAQEDKGDQIDDDIIFEPEEIVDDDEFADDSGYSDGNESVYYSSSDCGSLYSETDEEYGELELRRSTEKICFDPTSKIPVFYVGMKFKNVNEVRNAITRYTILKGLHVHLVKNDSQRVRAVCKESCPWKLLVSIHNADNTFTVKSYNPHHKCYRTNKTKFCNADFLSKYFKQRIMTQPTLKLKDFKELVKTELKIHASLHACRTAKKKIISELMGSYNEEYGFLHDYAAIICKTNPGSTCFAKSCSDNHEGKPKFTKFYVCLDACKKGWIEGCRPIIGLDGCFLKGMCKGQLLCAIGRDGNNQMFPIAWAIVQLETKVTWGWFLRCLKHDLPLGEGDGYTIISDMQKGLEIAMKEFLPNAEHRMCARHIYANWAKRWRGAERKIAFWNCARATFSQDLKNKLNVLEELGDGIVQDALRYNVESWCKAFFRTDVKCDVVDNNLSETFNGWILDARCKAIVSMLEEIRVQMMKRIWRKRLECHAWVLDKSPRAMEKLEKNKEKSFDWAVEWNGEDGYEIANIENRKLKHIVHIGKKTCSCREWDLTGIPCQHAVCAIYSKSDNPEHFVEHWYSKDTYLKAYAYSIQPVPGRDLWEPTGKEKIEPPEFKKMPGRPKKARRKDKDEVKKTWKLTKVGRSMTCGICKERGHNSRSCPNGKNDTLYKPKKYKKKAKVDMSAHQSLTVDGTNQHSSAVIINEFSVRHEKRKKKNSLELSIKSSSTYMDSRFTPGLYSIPRSSNQSSQPVPRSEPIGDERQYYSQPSKKLYGLHENKGLKLKCQRARGISIFATICAPSH